MGSAAKDGVRGEGWDQRPRIESEVNDWKKGYKDTYVHVQYACVGLGTHVLLLECM